MLTVTEKKSLQKVVAASSCSAIIILASFIGNLSAETITINFQPSDATTISSTEPTSTTCLFSIQLATDPAIKAAFLEKISASRVGLVETDDAPIYQTDIDVTGSNVSFNETGKSIDSLSNDCLACHDGVIAQNFKIRIKNTPGGRVMSLEDIIGGHPVGMEYSKYVSVDSKGYKNEVSFTREMIFAEGKVGCLTCHNPLNTAKGHLVMSNENSALCFTCHNK